MTWFFHRKVVDWRLIWAHQGLSVKVIKSLLVNIRAPSVMSWKINSFYPEMWTCTVYVSTVKLFGLHTDLSDCVRVCTYITMSPKFCFFFFVCFITVISLACLFFAELQIPCTDVMLARCIYLWHRLDLKTHQRNGKQRPSVVCSDTVYPTEMNWEPNHFDITCRC